MKFSNQAALLKKFRKIRGLTQDEIAEVACVHKQFISNMERGLCAISYSVAKALLRIGLSKELLRNAATRDFVRNWNLKIRTGAGRCQ